MKSLENEAEIAGASTDLRPPIECGKSKGATVNNELFARRRTLSVLGGLLLCSSTAYAQIYPDRVIRLVIPFPPGGGAENLARPLAKELSALLGQQVVPDFSPGAGGTIAATKVATASPDGYTLLLSSNAALTIGPHVTKVSYDALKSFAHISQIASSAYAFVVPDSSAFKTFSDLMSAAKTKPTGLNAGVPGLGSVGHLGLELLKTKTKTDIVPVGYKGTSPMLTDMLGGRLDFGLIGLGSVGTLVQEGRIRVLAVTGAKRSGALPNIPTVSEAFGIQPYEAAVFWGISAPANTPPAVVEKLNAALREVVVNPSVSRFWLERGLDPIAGSPQAFAELIRRDFDAWKDISKNVAVPN